MKNLFNVNESNHYFGKLVQITSSLFDELSLDIYPDKYFNIELVKTDNDYPYENTTLIEFTVYLWWLNE